MTNNNLLVKRVVDTVFPDLVLLLSRFIVSAEFHARKPQPEAYLRCLSRLGAEPGVTLFIDDSARTFSAEERAGLRSHLFWTSVELREALNRKSFFRTIS